MKTEYRDLWGKIIPESQLRDYHEHFLMDANSYRKYTIAIDRLRTPLPKKNSLENK